MRSHGPHTISLTSMIKELPKGSMNRNIQNKLLKNLSFVRHNSLHATERQLKLPLEVCKARLERM